MAQSAKKLYKKSQEAFEQGQFKKAIKYIDEALEKDPKNGDYYLLKGNTHHQMKEYKEEFEAYSKGIEMDPQSKLYNNRGILMMSAKEFQFAIEDYTHAIELEEVDTLKKTYYSNRGAAKSYIRDFEGAYQGLHKAYLIDTNDLAVLVNLGSVCDETGRGDETLFYLLKAIEIDSNFVGAYANIGFKYQEMGQHEKAIEYYDRVPELDPNEPLGYSNRSYNRIKIGDLKGAMKDINKSIKLYPDNSYAYRVRALIHIEEGNVEDACKDLQTALDKGFTLTYGEGVLNLQKAYCE